MKASVITALTWAACTMAGPIALQARGEDCTCELETVTITVPAPTVTGTIGGPTTTPFAESETETVTATNTATETAPEGTETATETATESSTETVTVTNAATETATNTVTETASNTVTDTATITATSVPAPSNPPDCEDDRCHGTGHIIQDLGPQVNNLLTVTGEDGEKFLVEVSEDVYNLLSGKVSLSDSVGEIIGSAATLGELIADLGPVIDCLLTVVGEDAQILLVQLAPEIADLLRGTTASLGLGSLANPVGRIIQSLGLNLKRDVRHTVVRLADKNGNGNILVDLEGAIAELLHGLNLADIVGTVIDIAIDVTELIQDLGPDSEDLLVVIGQNGQALLVRLAPEVAELVSAVLPEVGEPVGRVIAVTGNNL